MAGQDFSAELFGPSAGQDFSAELFGAKPPEKQSVIRQVADVPLGIAKGAVQGVRMIADAFGAGSDTSNTIKSAETYLADLMSAQSKNDQQEISRIMKDAEDKGVLDQVKAGIKAFTVAPVDTLAGALGTAAPVIAGALGAKILGAGALVGTGVSAALGAGMGAGTIKGSIYEETKRTLKEAGASEQDAEQRAQLAQEYGGKNLDQILLGTALGGAAAIGPLEKGAAGILARRILGKAGAKEAVEETAKGAVRRRVEAGALEALPEMVQAGQEQVAQNIALQREGFDVPTFRGAVSSATLEGIAGGGLGAALGGGKAEAPAPEAPPAAAPVAPPPVAPEVSEVIEPSASAAPTTEAPIGPTPEELARIQDEHETAIIEGLIAQDAEMARAKQLAEEQAATQYEVGVIESGIKDVDRRVREGRIFSRVQDLIDRNIPYASTAINDINQKFGVINEAPLTEAERARVENIMGMVNTFTNFVNLPVLAPRPVDQFAENQAMEALIKERKERGQAQPLRAAPVAPSPSIQEAPVSERVGEGPAIRPPSGVEPSVAEDSELVTTPIEPVVEAAAPVVEEPVTPTVEAAAPAEPSVEAAPTGEPPSAIEPAGFGPAVTEREELEKSLSEAQKAVRRVTKQSGSLWSALRGQLSMPEVRDISSDIKYRALGNSGRGRSRPSSVSTFVANGSVDEFLPFNMRTGSDYFDEKESTEYIKDKLREGNYLTYEAQMEIEQISMSIAQIEQDINELLTTKEINELIQEAIDEQAAATEEVAPTEPSDKTATSGAKPSEQEAGLESYTAEEAARKKGEQDKAAAEEKKSKAAEQARLQKEQIKKEEKTRADESVKDFELGKSAEEQMTGMGDLFVEPPAAKREPRQGTQKQLDGADGHAKDIGGTVVYQDGDISLVRGFSILTGQPVYVAVNGDYRSRVDIEGYTGNLVTPTQKDELIKVKKDLEAEDKAKFDKAPSVKFTDGLSTSPGVSAEIAGIVRGWKELLGLKPNLYITTIDDAVADRNKFIGPHRAIGSAGLDEKEAGVVRRLPNGDYYIAFKKSTSKTKMLEVLAHELGHMHEREVFNNADAETKKRLRDEHANWLMSQQGKSAKELIQSLRAKTSGKTTRVEKGLPADQLTPYWKSFGEWYADQVSRWAVTSEKPVSVVDKFFSRLAQALKSFYSKLKNAGYLPNETFVQYLEKSSNFPERISTDKDFSAQMVSEAKAAPSGSPGEQAISIVNSLGMGVKPPEPGAFEKAKRILKGENPDFTKESAKKSLQQLLDKIETMTFSADAAFNNELRRNLIRDMGENPEILGMLLEASQSQTVHADALASQFMIDGGLEYDDKLKKWQSVKKPDTFIALANKIEEIAKKYGRTKEEMERIAHTYFVAKRLPSILKRNEDIEIDIAEELSQDKPDRRKVKELESLKVFVSDEQLAMMQPGLSLVDAIPELKQVVDIWQGIRQNNIDVLVNSGLWSPEYAQAMWDNIDYVPYYREEQLEEGAGPQEFIRGLQVKSKEFQLKGSGAAVNDVFDNMIRWSQSAMNRAIRAHKAAQMIDAALKIDVGDRKMAVKVTEEKRGMNIARIFRDGKQELYDMADPLYVDAFSSIQNVSIPTLTWMSKLANVLRNSVVLYPMFSVAQVPQDSFAAMFSSGLKTQHALKIPYLAVKEFVTTLAKTSSTHKELVKFGLVGVRDFSATIVREDAEIYAGLKPPRGGWGKTKEFLSHIAMAADNSVRQAVYEASMQQGLDKSEALEKAFEIINFRRRGTSKMLNVMGQTVPFFYAYLSAQRVAYKTLTGVGISPTQRKEALTTLATTTAAVMTLSMLYAMANGDDEDYINTPAAVRDRTITIPGSGGVRIPLRPDFFLLPKIAAEHTYLLLTDKGYEDGAKFRTSVRDALVNAVASPLPVPQALKPLAEVAINYDFFQGKPILGQFEKNKDLGRQFNDSTSELSKLFGQTGLVSPILMDHLVRGMFGSVGGLTLFATNQFLHSDPDVPRPELSANEMLAALPGTSGFLKRPQESALKNDFYALRDEVEKAVNTFNDIKTRSPQGLQDFVADEKKMARYVLGKPVDQINRELAKIRKAVTQVINMPESQMSAEKKAEFVRQMRDVEREMLKSVNVKQLREMARI